MLFSELSNHSVRTIVVHDKWTVRDLVMTREVVQWIWAEANKHKSMFSTLTVGNVDNFYALLVDPNSVWFEVLSESEERIGIIYFMDMHRVIDCTAHVAFFDLMPLEKAQLCKQVARWMFTNFPLARITAELPHPHHRAISLAKRIGFKIEGRRRNAILLTEKLADEVILGLTREEAFNGR